MSRKGKSSRRWLAEHEGDPYVRRAREGGWRSRAVFKLEELDRRARLIRPGMSIVDLGAAPGAWSQYAARRLAGNGTVVALDLLPMEPLDGVRFIQGDFHEQAVLDELLAVLGETRVDLVMSDMAPNISGMRAVDQPRAMALAELVADLAARVLAPGGAMVVKLFHGEGFDAYVREARERFARVAVRKPKASRPASRETYLVAVNYRV